MSRHTLKIETTWVDSLPEGEGMAYLNSREINTRYGLGLAIATLFAALTCPVEEIDERIAAGERVAENYWGMARRRPGYRPSRTSDRPKAAQKAKPASKIEFDLVSAYEQEGESF